MITLSLDEFGDFENTKHKNEPILIGGVLFDDKDMPGEISNERKRIDAYYGEVIREASEKVGRQLSYPYDLHADSSMSGDDRNTKKENEKVTKTIVSETLGEFLKEGTYRGKDPDYINGNQVKTLPKRQGKYYLYSILKSKKGKEDRLSEDIGILRKDDYASNLYFHMASEVINRAVFQNPLLPAKSEFSLQIATRSSGNLDRASDLALQYKRLGYTPNKTYKNKNGEMVDIKLPDGKLAVYYQPMNVDIYRTIVEQYLMGKNEKQSKIKELKVEPISYKNPHSSQQMLYLADSVCSFLSFHLKNEKRETEEAWLNEMRVRGSNLVNKEDYLLFSYDSIDVVFSDALEAYETGDYYKALSVIYSAKKKPGEFAKFYSDTWFAYIENRIETSKDVCAFERLVENLYDSQLSNTYDQERGLYIISESEKISESMKEVITTPERQDIFFKMYLAAMISYCHIGNSAEAEAYYYKARKYAFSVSTEECIRARNSLAVCYCDCFEFEKALKISEENAEYANMLVALKQKVEDQLSKENTLLSGKTYSQLGQVLAFMKDDKAEFAFKKALMLLPEKSPNYFLTESYLLHYYIEAGDQKKYEDYALEYFGGNESLEDKLKYIESMKRSIDPAIFYKFGLFVFVKALVLFYGDKVSDDLLDSLCLIRGIKGHPAETVYKYLCIIAINKKDKCATDIFLQELESCEEKQGVLLNAIQELSLSEVLFKVGDIKKANVHRQSAINVLDDSFSVFQNMHKKSEDEIESLLDNYMTYMYR